MIACGPTARRFAPGDRVFGLVGGGGLADHVLVHELHVTGVPEQLDELAAAAVPEAFVTAHDAVLTQAGLRPGELLVVNGANGGVGTAAVQIAAAAGARVLATVRSAELREAVAALGATVIDPAELVAARAGRGWRRRRARARRRAQPRCGSPRPGREGADRDRRHGRRRRGDARPPQADGPAGAPARDDVARPAAGREGDGDARVHPRGRSPPREWPRSRRSSTGSFRPTRRGLRSTGSPEPGKLGKVLLDFGA